MFPFGLPKPKKRAAVDEFRPETGVYLGDLDNGVSEEFLYMELKNLGTVKYIKLHR